MKPIVLSLPGNEPLAARLASHLGTEIGQITVLQFSDGESYLRIESPVEGRDVVIVSSLHRPDDKVLPLLFAAATARELGASTVALVAPYLAYLRIDRRVHPGEAISSVYFAGLVSSSFDALVTVDPHLHRQSSLADLYSVPSRMVHAASLISDWIRIHVENPLLVGVHPESEEWVADLAAGAGAPFEVLDVAQPTEGDRSDPRLGDWRDKAPVLVDDIIASGATMIESANQLRAAGFAPPLAIGVHAVFAEEAFEMIKGAGVREVVTCNTIVHPTNRIDVAPLLAEAVSELIAESGATRERRGRR